MVKLSLLRTCPIADISRDDIDKLYETSEYHWFHHTEEWKSYTLNMREFGSKDLSFGIYQGEDLIAYSPLIKEIILSQRDKNEISMAGLPNVFPVLSDQLPLRSKEKIEKLVFQNIFDLAVKENISYMNFFLSPLSSLLLTEKIRVNPLSKFGFHDTTVTANILKLDKECEVLFRNFRKGTKSDIKAASKNGITAAIYDFNNISKIDFDRYRDIHFQAAGRQTRPDKTWSIMFEWVKAGLSILSIVSKNGEMISAQFINTYKKKAYYHSGATLPEFQSLRGVGHLGQWEIIKFLKAKDFNYYDLGSNVYPNISQESANKKLLGISKFKTGFGADLYPFFRGEWFSGKSFMLNSYEKRISEYFADPEFHEVF